MSNFRDFRDLENGNIISFSKQSTQLTSWFFTFNNYKKEDIDILETTLKPLTVWGCFQEEIGEKCGTPHLQGVILLKKKMRWSEFNLPKQICWSKTRNIKCAKEYCSKVETRAGITIKWGFPKPIKILENLYEWQEEIVKMCLSEPDDRTINWFWEDKGGIGKSTFIKYMVVKYNALLCQGGKHSDIINLVFNTDMEQSNIVMFDIPRAHKSNISYSALECIKNGMVCNTKYETGVKVFNSPHIIVFANYPPDITMLSMDRWNIKEIN